MIVKGLGVGILNKYCLLGLININMDIFFMGQINQNHLQEIIYELGLGKITGKSAEV